MQPVAAEVLQRESAPGYPVRTAGSAAPCPFCAFLRDSGGLHLWFAAFLRWRSDLLRTPTLLALEAVPPPSWRLSRDEAIATIRGELGPAAPAVIGSLSGEICWTGGMSCAYRARFEEREVVLQFSRPLFEAAEFAQFERSLVAWNGPIPETLLDAKVWAQFREWTRAGRSAASGRRLLEAVHEYQGTAITEFPRPIPPLCSERILGYSWMEGQPLAAVLASGNSEVLQKFCETLLEQAGLFSLVDIDRRLDNLILTPAGNVGLRFPPRFVTVPAVQVRRLLKYLSAGFSGNGPGAAHALLKLSGSETADDVRMLDALASVEPDLKVNLAFPASAAQFENQWRALALLQPARPLFLDCLHRNLIGAGFAAAQHRIPGDALELAHWPVLGRLLRSKIGDLLTRESAADWMMGSGLLMMETMRQMSRLVEDFRDDDVAVRVHLAGGADAGQQAAGNRTAALFIAGGILLALLLLSFRWGFSLSGGWSAAAAAGGVMAACGLYLVISHIE